MKTLRVVLLALLCAYCGGAGPQTEVGGNPVPQGPTVIEGSWSFDATDTNEFLLKVWYPGSSQAYFTWPQVFYTFDCPVSGTMQADGHLSVQEGGWFGDLTFTFEGCVIDVDTEISSGSLDINFELEKYTMSGQIKLNDSNCTTTLSGDWDVDHWSFCNHINTDANLGGL